jgi:hypothetical protein
MDTSTLSSISFSMPVLKNLDMAFDYQKELIIIQATACIVSNYLEYRTHDNAAPLYDRHDLEALITSVKSKLSE